MHVPPASTQGAVRPLLISVLAAVLVPASARAQVAPGAPVAPVAPVAGAPAQSALDTVRAGRFDAGKMWTFEYAPTDYFTQAYGFRADSAWFARARLAALRIPGCSASFVSPNGLVVTNHHCARGSILNVQKPGEHLLDTGFFSRSLAEERKLPGYWVEQLIAVEDVSDEVFSTLDAVTGDSAREQARARVFEAMRQRVQAKYGAAGAPGSTIEPQIVGLYHGGRYSAYVFRRYTDVRLVAAPEEQMGFFGGDPDNFTYPRYDLDFSFLRVYDGAGKPLATPSYFRFSATGAAEGQPVFVIGNPGPTARGLTVAQLEFQRDVQLPPRVAVLRSRVAAMRAELKRDPAGPGSDALRNAIFGVSNSLKALGGQLEALQDPVVMAKRRDAERAFRAAVQARPELAARWGPVFDRIAELQRQKAKLAPQYAAFAGFGRGPVAAALSRAAEASRLLAAPGDTAARRRLLEVADQSSTLQRAYLIQLLREITSALGPADALTGALLAGRTPEQAADAMLTGSAFATAAATTRALNGHLPSQDPAIRMLEAVRPALSAFDAETDRLERTETDLQEQLGRARFEVYGTAVPPDATFSPRIADGVVEGYDYNGTRAPWHTTFFGMYDRYWAFRGDPDFALPARWVPVPRALDLNTPLDFVSTADTFGGNSGSPAVSKDLELLGLNFDRNVEGLSRAYIYLPERGQRNVMVDVRAVREALRDVYGASRVVKELATGSAQ